jgi:hypothetical protein
VGSSTRPHSRDTTTSGSGAGSVSSIGLTHLFELRSSLEERQCGKAVEAGREAQGGGPALEEVGGDRLRHHPTPRGDLVEIEVLEAVIEKQRGVSLLQLGTDIRLGEIGQPTVEIHPRRDEEVLLPPSRGHRGGREILQGVGPERIGERLPGREVGTEVGEHLTQ